MFKGRIKTSVGLRLNTGPLIIVLKIFLLSKQL